MHPVTLLAESVKKYPDEPALSSLGDSGVTFLYRELFDRVQRLAVFLHSEGIHPSDRVALSAENSPFWGAAYYGILAAGATVVPFDMNLPAAEIEFILRDSGAKAWIGSETAFTKTASINAGSIQKIPIRNDFPPVENWQPVPFAATAVMVYTSGTTGVAKGVMLSGEALTVNVTGASNRFHCDRNERFLSILPLYHTYECTFGLLLPMSIGGSVAYARSLKPKELLADSLTVRPTMVLAVPLILEKIRNNIFRTVREAKPVKRWLFRSFLLLGYLTTRRPGDGLGKILFQSVRRQMGFDRLRILVSGGAALPHSVERDLMALGFPLLQGYGLTECAPLVAVNSLWFYRPTSVGKPLEYAETRIEEPDADGVGMLYVRGPMVMNGYWNNPEKTAEALTEDGWFRTGDLARFDSKGALYIVGRRKDVIVTAGGKNIYPETLEQAILEDHRVLEVIVVGKPRKQGQGEEVGAILVFNPDWLATEAAEGKNHSDEELQRLAVEICAKVNSAQPEYRHITRIEVSRDELAKTPTRKVQRFKYRTTASDQTK